MAAAPTAVLLSLRPDAVWAWYVTYYPSAGGATALRTHKAGIGRIAVGPKINPRCRLLINLLLLGCRRPLGCRRSG